MLVVIAIIGILAALLLPSMNSALESSRELSCASNLRNTGIIAATYAGDFYSILPAATARATNTDFPVASYGWATLPVMLSGYAAGLSIWQWGSGQPVSSFSRVFVCPTDRDPTHYPQWSPGSGITSIDPRNRIGYTVNSFAWLCLNDRNVRMTGTEGFYRQMRLAEVRKPSATAFYGDGMNAFTDGCWLTVSSGGLSVPDYVQTPSGNVKWSNWSGLRLGHRQSNGYNILFFDGHVTGYSAPYYPPSLGTAWMNAE